MARRTTMTITVSISPAELEKVESLARRERKSKSQLFRDMLENYEEDRQERALEELLKFGEQTAKRLEVKTEADIERLIHEVRGIED